MLPDPQAGLLIVVDQMEELFTMTQDVERTRFLAGLRAAALEPDGRVRVIATLRADFYDAPLSVPAFGDLLAARTEAITPMSPEELERAIVAPADQAGLVVEPRLLAEMIADVADRPGALPLLQYALTELAERADRRTLTLDAYRRIGRVSGALARRAEALLDPMNGRARDACRQLFLRLVTLGEGTEDTRRRVRRSELATLAEPQTMDAVIETFGRHRLVSFDRDPDTREPTIEIAHEALLREWARMRGWIDDAREGLRQRARISSGTQEWIQADRSPDYLLSGIRLAQAEEATTGGDTVRLTVDEREFVDAGIAHRDAGAAAERMRHERELTLERRARTRLRGLVAVLAAALLVAGSLTAVAVNQSREAQRRSDEARIAAITGASLSNLNSDPELSVLLALNAIDGSTSRGQPVPSETVTALHWAMQDAGIEYPVSGGPTAVAASPFGVRGIFDLPLSDLTRTAREGVERSLTPEECERFLGVSTCPSLPSVSPRVIVGDPIETIPTPADQPLLGTQVTLYGGNDQDRITALRSEFEGFTAQTGIEVRLIGNPNYDDYVAQSLEAGDPPDVAIVAQPAYVRDFAREGSLIDLGAYVDIDKLKNDQSPYLVSLGTVGDDGSWPASEGTTYGAVVDLTLKSMIWYPVPEFRNDGFSEPKTWNELIAISDRLVRQGSVPWCMGWESGTATGWPGTDWIESLLLKDAGTEVYDDWTFHRLPFDSPSVREAFGRLGRILFTSGYVADGAIESPWPQAQLPMIDQHGPGCWLYLFPDFARVALPSSAAGTSTNFFPFPSIGPDRNALIGGGSIMSVFSDRPEVREVVRYLLSPGYGTTLIGGSIHFISANQRFDASRYSPFERNEAELVNAALATDTFRFDASDLMPPEIGSKLFWDAMMRYAREGPESLDDILAELDAAWPDDG